MEGSAEEEAEEEGGGGGLCPTTGGGVTAMTGGAAVERPEATDSPVVGVVAVVLVAAVGWRSSSE